MSTPLESQLAYLGFDLLTPSPALRPYVQSYWYFRRDTPLLTHHEEYMHPRGGFGMVFNFGASVYLDGQVIPDPLFLDGTTTRSRKMGFLGHVELLGIRFHEGGAYRVLGVPLADLRNQTWLLDVLDRPSLLRLHAQLHEAPALPARIQLLEAWLIGRLALGKAGNGVVPASLKLLRASGGQISMAQLAQECAISQRQLERLYQCQVGMSPKQYTQLLRVDRARLALKRMRQSSTTALSMELGFYDQPHFIREFSAVVGMTPYAYMKRNRTQTT
jgi:AraC-like DNA-binding protein